MSRAFSQSLPVPGFLLALLFLFGGPLSADPPIKDKDDPTSKVQSKLGIFSELTGGKGGSLGLGGGKELTLSAEFRIAANGRDGVLSVKAVMADGWHVYSLTQPLGSPGPTASRLKVAESEQIESVGAFTAKQTPKVRTVKEFSVPVEEHDGEVIWSAPLRLAENVDPKELSLAIRYDGQVCAETCIPKINIPVTAKYAGVLESPLPASERSPASEPFRLPGAMLTLQGSLDKSVVAPGGKLKLSITATPDPEWFVYALEKRDPNLVSKPTLIVLTETGGLIPSDPVPSAPPKIKQTGIPKSPEAKYHTAAITWTMELHVPKEVAEGECKLAGLIGYQTCKDTNCLPPSVAEFHATVTVGTVDKVATVPITFQAAAPRTRNAKEERITYTTVAKLAESAQPAAAGLDLTKIKVDSDTANMPLYWVLPIALLGGFILNFMPCVLPVIGLKILSFVQQAGESRARVFALNVWYSLGMLAVFMVLATLAVVWNLGWGEQNNNNIFNVAMVAVVFTMGLSFLGVWEIPIPGFVGGHAATSLAQKEGPAGAFFKGAITTLLATPCSGPGLATALAWCNGKPPHLVYLVFACLGLGMALPYLVIGASPSLVKLLPKPGAWMETFKQIMGFVLLGTVVFIFTYMPVAIIVPTVALLFGLWAACWWIGRTPLTAELSQTLVSWFGGAVVAGVVGAFAFLWLAPYMNERFAGAVDREITQRQTALAAPTARAAKEHELPWQPFSLDKLGELTSAKKTVMVDFTADWCLTCKTLEATVLNTKDVRQAVEKHQIETLVADWTTYDPQIGELLEALGSNKQIPVLAIFPAGRPNEPIVLIGGYTQGMLIKRLEEAAALAEVRSETSTAMK